MKKGHGKGSNKPNQRKEKRKGLEGWEILRSWLNVKVKGTLKGDT
jgi:stalled ribosome alternative rescue factor ArfA